MTLHQSRSPDTQGRALSSGAGKGGFPSSPANTNCTIGNPPLLALIGSGSPRMHKAFQQGLTWKPSPRSKEIRGVEMVPCGGTLGVIRCENGHERIARARCREQDCPECKDLWIRQEVEAISARYDAGARMFGKVKNHVVFSFREAPTTEDEYRACRALVVKLATLTGLGGGVLVPHVKTGRAGIHFHGAVLGSPRRCRCKAWRQAKTDEEERKCCRGCKIKCVPFLYDRYGVVIKKIRPIWAAGSLASYELDHCVKPRGTHTVTYFGLLNSYHLKVVETPISSDSCCKLCGAVEREIRRFCTEDGVWVLDPVHVVKRNVYTFIRRSGKG